LDLDRDNDNIGLEENTELNEMEETFLGSLSIEDWMTIQKFESLFISTMQDDNAHTFRVDLSDRDSAMTSCLQQSDQIALRFINFFRQIDEFEGLDVDDRFILTKYNLLPVFPIYKCFKGTLPLRKSIFFKKFDFSKTTYSCSPECPLSEYVWFI